jgi:hypothetical protein
MAALKLLCRATLQRKWHAASVVEKHNNNETTWDIAFVWVTMNFAPFSEELMATRARNANWRTSSLSCLPVPVNQPIYQQDENTLEKHN